MLVEVRLLIASPSPSCHAGSILFSTSKIPSVEKAPFWMTERKIKQAIIITKEQ